MQASFQSQVRTWVQNLSNDSNQLVKNFSDERNNSVKDYLGSTNSKIHLVASLIIIGAGIAIAATNAGLIPAAWATKEILVLVGGSVAILGIVERFLFTKLASKINNFESFVNKNLSKETIKQQDELTTLHQNKLSELNQITYDFASKNNALIDEVKTRYGNKFQEIFNKNEESSAKSNKEIISMQNEIFALKNEHQTKFEKFNSKITKYAVENKKLQEELEATKAILKNHELDKAYSDLSNSIKIAHLSQSTNLSDSISSGWAIMENLEMDPDYIHANEEDKLAFLKNKAGQLAEILKETDLTPYAKGAFYVFLGLRCPAALPFINDWKPAQMEDLVKLAAEFGIAPTKASK